MEKIKTKVDHGSLFPMWFVLPIAFLFFGAVAGYMEKSWLVFGCVFLCGGMLLPSVLTRVFFYSSTSKMEERYRVGCEGDWRKDAGGNWICHAQKIPIWCIFSEKVNKDSSRLLSEENVIQVDDTSINIYDFSMRTETKRLTTDEMLLLGRYGNKNSRFAFEIVYNGTDLPWEVIETIHERDPLWIFSFRDFTEDQLSRIIDTWSPLELQGLQTSEKKGTRTPVLGMESEEDVYIIATSKRNIMDLMKLFSPEGELMKKLKKKLEGHIVLKPYKG